MRRVYHRATATVTQIVVWRPIFRFVNQLCLETEWSRRHTVDQQMAIGVVLQDIRQIDSSHRTAELSFEEFGIVRNALRIAHPEQ